MLYQIHDEKGDLILRNRVALVTGASGGIGSVTAKMLAQNGAQVAVHYNSKETAASAVVADIIAHDGRARAIHADLTSEKDVATMFETVELNFGQIDILVANAGIFPPDEVDVDAMDVERVRKVFATTVEATILCAGRFFSLLRRVPRPGANMVIIGSTSGIYGEKGHVEYAAAKSALVGMTYTLGNEITRIVPDGRVNLIAPGWLRSGMTEQFMGDLDAIRGALQTRAIRRIGRPEDTAQAVLFLVSPLAGYITKQVLRVDGGMEGRRLWSETENKDLTLEQMI